jgi:RNA recognition motif-containing protein
VLNIAAGNCVSLFPVGEVAFVELYHDENDKPRGCGIVEFESADSVKKAVEKMHRFDLKGRKLVVKEVSKTNLVGELTLYIAVLVCGVITFLLHFLFKCNHKYPKIVC